MISNFEKHSYRRRRIKPRIVVDLCRPEIDSFSQRAARVNLGHPRIIKIPFRFFAKTVTILSVFSYLIFGSVLAPIEHGRLSLAAQNEEERQQLEEQLAELEIQIEEYQNTVDKYRSEGRNLESEIGRLNAKIRKLNLQIKSIRLTMVKLDDDIEVNLEGINNTENEIDKSKEVLSRSLQNIYVNENLSIIEILLRQPRLSDFFSDVNDLIGIQEGMRLTLEKVMGLREDLLDKKEALAIKRNDAEQLRAYQNAQRQTIQSTKAFKANILEVTKGREAKYKTLLKETQKTAVQIRSQIFQLLGGGELTFEKAYELAKFAEQATGIRAAMILAVLDRESALGQNVGRCSYKTAMHPRRDLPVFLKIIEELQVADLAPPEPIMVSCPNRDGYYGGAMGPAQFIPSTWVIYDNKIAEITGNNPPNPWSNVDAFVGTALYLSDSYGSGSCRNYANENSHISPKQLLQERCAAAKYYAGGRWYRYRWAYGQPVVDRANTFQKDIDILNS